MAASTSSRSSGTSQRKRVPSARQRPTRQPRCVQRALWIVQHELQREHGRCRHLLSVQQLCDRVDIHLHPLLAWHPVYSRQRLCPVAMRIVPWQQRRCRMHGRDCHLQWLARLLWCRHLCVMPVWAGAGRVHPWHPVCNLWELRHAAEPDMLAGLAGHRPPQPDVFHQCPAGELH